MNEIQIFTGAFGTIRTVTLNNEPYFVGKDVADILGYTEDGEQYDFIERR